MEDEIDTAQKMCFATKVICQTADKHSEDEKAAMMAIAIQEGGILNAYRSVQPGTAVIPGQKGE